MVPMCARPEVLAQVEASLRSQGSTASIVPGEIRQMPGAAPHTLACAVRLQQAVIDTNRRGLTPEWRTVAYPFTVRQGQNGLFVAAPPVPPWLDGTGP